LFFLKKRGCANHLPYLHKRLLIIAVMAFLLLLIGVMTLPAFAQTDTALISEDQSFRHTIIYEIGGRISINREIGHACTTGAVKRQNISGYGDMSKIENIRINNNIMKIDEVTNWSTAANSIEGLLVTTTLQLCARPMSAAAENYSSPALLVYKDDLVPTYHPYVVGETFEVYGLTRQVWATSILTNPGEEGSYHADFIAAYGPGPYERLYGVINPHGDLVKYDEKFMWEYDENVSYFNRDSRTKGYKRGDYYVGNYFNIEQYARTTGGDLKRFFSMSSPFEGTYIEEDLHVVGMAAVRDSFEMHNLARGKKAVTLAWYELF
jgi:hypothetical protein